MGILDFLDEETRLPSGSDNNLVTKLYNRFASPPNTSAFFGKPRFGNSEFIIKHYALDVTYQIEGFIEKNKDTVSEEILETLQTTSFDFMKTFITVADVEQSPGPNRSGRSKKPTLGSIFKNSLIQLMDTLRATNPHYIRCIKPNQAKVAFEFEPQNVLGQLVACGVLETIKISRAGYPSKQLFQDFVDRYYFLVSSSQWKTAPKKLCHTIASSCIKGENKFELGKSKIFFRAGQLAYLEKKRSVKFTAIITLIQKNARRNFHQKKYVAMRQGAVKIQAVWRGKSARIRYHAAQKERAVVRIQKNMRMCIARKSYKKILSAAICIQCAWRRHVRRRDFEFYAREKAALDIQRVWRGHKSRKSTSKILGRIILIQSCIRRRRARLQFKLLRVEARSVGNLQQVNYKLESKILQLSQKINQTKEDRTELAEKAATLESQLHTWKDKFARLEAEFKEKSVSTEQECVDLKKQIIRLLEAKEIMSKEAEKANNMVKKRDDQLAALTAENESLKKSSKATESKKNSSKEESATLISLRREVVSLREQMSRLVTGKYSTDKATENFLGNSYTPVPSTAKSMSFLESAALVTAQVAESWMGGARAPDAAATTIQTIPLDEQEKEFAEPMGRATRMLQANDLQEEVTECLIRKLRIPLPNTKSVSTRKEILFPAHLIGYLLNQMVQHEMVSRLVSTADIVLRSIRQLTIEFQDDYLSAFWTSNVIELAAILGTIRERVPLPAAANQDDQLSPNAALAKIREECEILLTEMYHGWVKEIKKRLVAMIVPAVIDSQSLPGYICEKPASIWGKVGFSRPVPAFSIDQLLKFITKLSNTMKCYYLQDALCRQLLTELVRYIGVSAFNHLLTRKNFLTWKRGVQIQFNVSRIEEWCLGNGITEATLHLQQLLQAGKLLTLNKTTQSDMETIYDVCFLLNHSQINKILMLYYASDFDSPVFFVI